MTQRLGGVRPFLQEEAQQVQVSLLSRHVESGVPLVVHLVKHGPPDPLLQELVPHGVGTEVARVVERDLKRC